MKYPGHKCLLISTLLRERQGTLVYNDTVQLLRSTSATFQHTLPVSENCRISWEGLQIIVNGQRDPRGYWMLTLDSLDRNARKKEIVRFCRFAALLGAQPIEESRISTFSWVKRLISSQDNTRIKLILYFTTAGMERILVSHKDTVRSTCFTVAAQLGDIAPGAPWHNNEARKFMHQYSKLTANDWGDDAEKNRLSALYADKFAQRELASDARVLQCAVNMYTPIRTLRVDSGSDIRLACWDRLFAAIGQKERFHYMVTTGALSQIAGPDDTLVDLLEMTRSASGKIIVTTDEENNIIGGDQLFSDAAAQIAVATLSRLDITPGKGLLAGILGEPLLHKFSTFIRFFECDVETNIDNTVLQLLAADTGLPDFHDRMKIFTPLLMDFECADHCAHERLVSQVRSMRDGIGRATTLTDNRVTILPFLGFDLRRLEETTEDDLEQWFAGFLHAHEVDIRSTRDTPGVLPANGEFIGIKLYLSLGGELLPEHRPELCIVQLAFFKLLCERKIPITVHCQQGSFKLGDENNNTLINYAHPKHWEKILSTPGLETLIINFAHFGGEGEVDKLIYLNPGNSDGEGPEEYPAEFSGTTYKSWTYPIIRMLKKYPNTYSDISAFDHEGDPSASFKFGWLLALEEENRLPDAVDGEYRLQDKLLFGSDYPMLLKYTADYQELVAQCRKTLDIGHWDYPQFDRPPKIIDQGELMEKMTNENPAKFLFG